ncbi:hypothetical protein SAY86_000682 [Trapa natans]|uniref:Uncharacterized protein n=1 Tax=Trapa natans TaxID=22666 RepID=A0AAN7MBC7_TRANT|nr:hypothetical protein SAY86_000682 [Trapa natans]
MVRNMEDSCYELSLRDLVEVSRKIGQERVFLPEWGQVGGGAAATTLSAYGEERKLAAAGTALAQDEVWG